MNSKSEIEKAEAEALAFFDAVDRDDAPTFEDTLRAHRSLTRRGFVWVIGIISVGFLIPILAFLGNMILWGLLIPCLATLCALWYFIERNQRDRQVHEIVRLWPDLLAIERVNPREPNQYWIANPHWVKFQIKDTKEVESYLTVTGGHREIELGAFLTPEERSNFRYRIEGAIRKSRNR